MGGVLFLLQCIAAALFSGLRVYAISGRNWWLFIVVFTLNMVPFATNLFRILRQTLHVADNFDGCVSVLQVSEDVKLGSCTVSLYTPTILTDSTTVSLSTRGSVVLADVIVLAVTLNNTMGTLRIASRLLIRVPVSEILLRDGALFFLALLGTNTVVLLSNVLPTSKVSGLPIVSGSFLQSLPPIIMSRFMLNLRQAACTSGSFPTKPTMQWSTIRLVPSNLIGNIGEPLVFEEENEDQDGDVEGKHFAIEHIELDSALSLHGYGRDSEESQNIVQDFREG
ncbi:hypothetical protein BC835DRAFT_1421349 [Cytidiella melzeri]|nr:hypothetical protein BC835DRAFT_1421349 [Cytidiella melzeri]